MTATERSENQNAIALPSGRRGRRNRAVGDFHKMCPPDRGRGGGGRILYPAAATATRRPPAQAPPPRPPARLPRTRSASQPSIAPTATSNTSTSDRPANFGTFPER